MGRSHRLHPDVDQGVVVRRGRGYAAKRRVTFVETPPDEPEPVLNGPIPITVRKPLLPAEWVQVGFVPVITEEDIEREQSTSET